MKKRIRYQSRRKTPWDNLNEEQRTPLETYLRDLYKERFSYHHQSLEEMNDSYVFDQYSPKDCPYCGSTNFVRNGRYKATGLQRYTCRDCQKSFCITTGTIFQDHKISIGEWMQFLLNLFDYVSLNSDSKNNKNSFTTSRFWLQKVFLVLCNYQDQIVLCGKVYLDETYYSVRKSDLIRKDDGKLLRGISKNQICISAAADKRRVFCKIAGNGKPTSEKTLSIFKDHIKKKSTLIHDGEQAHETLVDALKLKEEIYLSDETKGMDDLENPLDRINNVHSLLKWFLDSHSSFLRKNIDGFVNLFVFTMNPPLLRSDLVQIVDSRCLMASFFSFDKER